MFYKVIISDFRLMAEKFIPRFSKIFFKSLPFIFYFLKTSLICQFFQNGFEPCARNTLYFTRFDFRRLCFCSLQERQILLT